MRQTSLFLVSCALSASLALAQAPRPTGYTTYLPVTGPPKAGDFQPVTSAAPLPLWNYSIVADAGLGGGTFTGTVVGRSPFSRGKTTTTIPTQIIPLIITINDGVRSSTQIYDPTVVDACAPASHTDVDIITGSPIFTNNTWMMGPTGSQVNVGNTQYIDAFQRAEFWSLVAGTPYHLILNQSTLPTQTLTFNTSLGKTGALQVSARTTTRLRCSAGAVSSG